MRGAIAIVDGKAKLIRDDYCDGLGNCLPVCPVDAIHVIGEAAAYDEAAVKRAKARKADGRGGKKRAGGQKSRTCPPRTSWPAAAPGTQVRAMHHPAAAAQARARAAAELAGPAAARAGPRAVF